MVPSLCLLRTVVFFAGSYPVYMTVTSLLSFHVDAAMLLDCTVMISPLIINYINILEHIREYNLYVIYLFFNFGFFRMFGKPLRLDLAVPQL